MRHLFVLIAALFISFNVFAGENTTASVLPIGQSAKFALKYENPKSDKIRVKIYDTKDNLVHNEFISKETAQQRIYDLSSIGAGTYKVVILDGEVRDALEVTVGSKTTDKKFVATLFPSISKNHIYANVSENNDVVTLSFKDKEGKVLYSEDISDASADRVLNTSKLPSGWYTLEVVGNNNTTTQEYFVD